MDITGRGEMEGAIAARTRRWQDLAEAQNRAQIAQAQTSAYQLAGARDFGGYRSRDDQAAAQQQRDAMVLKEAEARMRRQGQMMGIMAGMFGSGQGGAGALSPVQAPALQPVSIPSLGGGSGMQRGGIGGGGIFSALSNLTNGLSAAGNQIAQNRAAQGNFNNSLTLDRANQERRSNALNDISRLSSWAGL